MRSLALLASSLRRRNDWHSQPHLRAVRYLLRCLYAPKLHALWLRTLANPLLRFNIRRDTHLFERWQHRWVSVGFSPIDRLTRLIDHHGMLCRLLPATLIEQLWTAGHLVVGGAPAKDGTELQVVLFPPVKRCLEGELLMGLFWRDALVFSMTVTLCPKTDEVLVGCIQGPRSEAGLAQVRELTRLCHGLRPKDLLLSLTRVLATAVGAGFIRGPGNQMQVFGDTTRVKASYDTFWLEAGATLRPDGLFETSSVEPRRELLQVPSKHRSAFRTKEALRQSLTNALAAFLLPPQGPVPCAEPTLAPAPLIETLFPAEPVAA